MLWKKRDFNVMDLHHSQSIVCDFFNSHRFRFLFHPLRPAFRFAKSTPTRAPWSIMKDNLVLSRELFALVNFSFLFRGAEKILSRGISPKTKAKKKNFLIAMLNFFVVSCFGSSILITHKKKIFFSCHPTTKFFYFSRSFSSFLTFTKQLGWKERNEKSLLDF